MPSSPTATFGRGITYARPYVAFAFQAFKRRVYGTDCDFTPGARFNLTSDRGAVGVATEPQQCEENELLEFAERRCHETHIVHNVDDISSTALDTKQKRANPAVIHIVPGAMYDARRAATPHAI